jgi:hypothetical protein
MFADLGHFSKKAIQVIIIQMYQHELFLYIVFHFIVSYPSFVFR